MLFWFVFSVVEFIFGDNYQLKTFEFSDVFLISKSSFLEAWGLHYFWHVLGPLFGSYFQEGRTFSKFYHLFVKFL